MAKTSATIDLSSMKKAYDDSSKVATNYIDFEATNGLRISQSGDYTKPYVQIVNSGINIIKDSTHKVTIDDTNGMRVYANDASNAIAVFGTTVIIGKNDGNYLTISDSNLISYNDGKQQLNIGLVTTTDSIPVKVSAKIENNSTNWSYTLTDIVNNASYNTISVALTPVKPMMAFTSACNFSYGESSTKSINVTMARSDSGGSGGGSISCTISYNGSQTITVSTPSQVTLLREIQWYQPGQKAPTFDFGMNSPLKGSYSFTAGLDCEATGKLACAIGYKTTASGWYSYAEGRETLASESNSHAEGFSSIASENASHAEGSSTIASQISAHAEGGNTIASGPYSHAEGYYTIASNSSAHAEGEYTRAQAWASHSQNYYTVATEQYQTAIGKYNKVTRSGSGTEASPYTYSGAGNYAFIIGNGTGDTTANRSNALTVDWNGGIQMYLDSNGTASADATSGTDKDLFNAIRTLGWYSAVIS